MGQEGKILPSVNKSEKTDLSLFLSHKFLSNPLSLKFADRKEPCEYIIRLRRGGGADRKEGQTDLALLDSD